MADNIRASLEEAGFNIFMDVHDIVAGEDWQTRQQQMIASGDKFVFVLSNNSLSSEVCRSELDMALRLNKPVIPLAIDEHLDLSDIPEPLARLNFVQLRGDSMVSDLITLKNALQLDLNWLRMRAALIERVEEWEQLGRPDYLLLSGSTLVDAEDWRGATPAREYIHGALDEFIRLSRLQELKVRKSRRSRRMTIAVMGLILGFVLIAAAATSAYFINQNRQLKALEEGLLQQLMAIELENARAGEQQDDNDDPSSNE